MTIQNVVVGIVGHVDHGKTSFIKTITGIDTDRLPEEKKRGLSIEPGFAYLETPDFNFDFVDIPGHKNFLHNALRSLWGIDIAIIIVAADDGVMPQTVEHFHILKALEAKKGFIVLTKCDLVDKETLMLAEEEIINLIKSSFFEENPIIRFSSTDGTGKSDVINTLLLNARNIQKNQLNRVFRFFIDRSFILKGHGRVVTGLVTSGEIHVGEKLQVYPTNEIATVKRLHRHNKEVDRIRQGERAGINLSIKTDLNRGLILGKPGELQPSFLVNAYLTVFDSAPRPLIHHEKVYIYHLSTESTGKIVLCGKEALKPGESDFAQIRLDSPIVPFYRDHLIIRFMCPDATAAGGTIIDPHPPKLRRGTYHYIEKLKQLKDEDEGIIFIPLMRSYVKSLEEISKETGITQNEILFKLNPLIQNRKITKVGENSYALTEKLVEAKDKLINILKQMAKDHTLPSFMSFEELYTRVSPPFSIDIFQLILPELISDGQLEEHMGKLRLKSKNLTRKQTSIRENILKKIAGSPPLRESEIFSSQDDDRKSIQNVLNHLINEGLVIRFKDGAYMEKNEFNNARQAIINYLKKNHEISVIQAKEILGWGRRATISFLEHLDRQGITIRDENTRHLSSKESVMSGPSRALR